MPGGTGGKEGDQAHERQPGRDPSPSGQGPAQRGQSGEAPAFQGRHLDRVGRVRQATAGARGRTVQHRAQLAAAPGAGALQVLGQRERGQAAAYPPGPEEPAQRHGGGGGPGEQYPQRRADQPQPGEPGGAAEK